MLLALPVGWLAFAALFGPKKPGSRARPSGLEQTVAR
jgi:hypothetical protein